LLLGLVLLTWSAKGGALPGEGGPGQLFIQIEGERLTVSAREISHRRLLEELARQLNFELILAGPLEQPRSLEIKGRPWEQALRMALAPASWAVIYESVAGRPRLIKVVVFPSEETNTRWARKTEASPYSTVTAIEQPQSPGQPVEQEVERHPEAAEAALHASDHEVRLTAIAHLGQQADHEALRVLLEIMGDSDPKVEVLESAVAALEALVQRAEDREVQQLAAEALGLQLEPVTAEAVPEPMTKVSGE
jgi:hypothetical protein